MNIKAPKGTRNNGKVHKISDDGLTVCRVKPRDTWSETDDLVDCQACIGKVPGWKANRTRSGCEGFAGR